MSSLPPQELPLYQAVMSMPSNKGITFFSLCLLIILCVSANSFVVAGTPLSSCWRRQCGLGLPRRSNNRNNFLHCPSIRCGGGTEDDGDINNKSKQRMILSPYSITTWYMNQLDTHELRTKFVSSAILALVGDVCAQKIVTHYVNPIEAATAKLDKRRMLAMFIDGLVCTGPLLHYVYEFYEWILPTHDNNVIVDTKDGDTSSGLITAKENPSSARKRFLNATLHVLFDNFIMAFVYIAVIMITTGLLEGRQSTIVHELKHDLIPSLKVSWRVSILGYIPAQLLSFHFLPIKLRVLAVNILDVIWVTAISYVTHRNRH